MKKIIPMLFSLCVIFSAAVAADETVAESDIDLCTTDDECIVVPYSHCCGASRRAINQEYLSLYEQTPEWQSFSEPVCATMGMCPNYSEVTTAVCREVGVDVKRCRLDWRNEREPKESDPCPE